MKGKEVLKRVKKWTLKNLFDVGVVIIAIAMIPVMIYSRGVWFYTAAVVFCFCVCLPIAWPSNR